MPSQSTQTIDGTYSHVSLILRLSLPVHTHSEGCGMYNHLQVTQIQSDCLSLTYIYTVHFTICKQLWVANVLLLFHLLSLLRVLPAVNCSASATMEPPKLPSSTELISSVQQTGSPSVSPPSVLPDASSKE